MGHVDRTEVLCRIDLGELATEICGPPTGRGRSTKWHCPNPDHPDAHPSMSLYPSRQGYPRWKCHACGEGGTAVDLLMIGTRLNPGQALRELAARAGLHPDDRTRALSQRPSVRPRTPASPVGTTAIHAPAASGSDEPNPAIERFVAQAADLLWQPIGDGARQYLHHRGLSDPILRANRVGFDPGPRHVPRPPGLPRFGPGIVYPVLHPTTGGAIYYQLRYLDPRTAASRKYDQPIADLAANPKLAHIRPPTSAGPAGVVVVCEGFPDGLSVAHTGLIAVAVLGVAHAGADAVAALATRLVGAHPDATFLVAVDADRAGTAAASRLTAHLARQAPAVARIAPPTPAGDINGWWQSQRDVVTRLLIGTAQTLSTLDGGPWLPALDLPTPPTV